MQEVVIVFSMSPAYIFYQLHFSKWCLVKGSFFLLIITLIFVCSLTWLTYHHQPKLIIGSPHLQYNFWQFIVTFTHSFCFGIVMSSTTWKTDWWGKLNISVPTKTSHQTWSQLLSIEYNRELKHTARKWLGSFCSSIWFCLYYIKIFFFLYKYTYTLQQSDCTFCG